MTAETVRTRNEYLYNLTSFCQLLHETMLAAGLKPEQTLGIFHNAVSAACLGCGIVVSGDELLALTRSPSAEDATAKIGRLRQGYCARQGCEACYYQLSFRDQELNWPKILAQVDARLQGPIKRRSSILSWKLVWPPASSTLAYRFALALAVILLLLLVRQWRQGGRIPFIREPENFRVDPAPEAVRAY